MVKLASVTFISGYWPWGGEIYLAHFSCEVLIGGKKVIVFKTSVLEPIELQGLQKWSVGFVFTFQKKKNQVEKQEEMIFLIFSFFAIKSIYGHMKMAHAEA